MASKTNVQIKISLKFNAGYFKKKRESHEINIIKDLYPLTCTLYDCLSFLTIYSSLIGTK